MPVKALDERPTLNYEFKWLYDAYRVLSRSRTLGTAGEYYIPCTEFVAYCSIQGFTSVELKTFLLEVIQHVDGALLAEKYENNKPPK